MAKKPGIKQNFAYQMIYEILVIILPFITSPYIARTIGAEGLGTYSYYNSIAYYFVLFSAMGIKNYGNRSIARCRDDKDELNKTFSSILGLHVIISLIFTLGYMGYCLTQGTSSVFAWIQVAYVVSALFDISWFYFGMEKFKTTVTRNTIIRILNIICVFAFVHDADDLWKYCLIMSLGSLISQLSLWIPLHRYVKIVRPHFRDMLPHLKPMLILFIPGIAVSMYKYMDKIMIGSLSSKTELGFYENAEKVINIPSTIISSFGTVMLPKMSNLAGKSDNRKAGRYMGLSMEFVMCLAFGLTFGLAGVGSTFVPIFWGDGFMRSGSLIAGLTITIPFISFANVVRTQYLLPHQRDKEYSIALVSGAVINLVINFLLIPHIGATGATIGTVVTEILVCFLQVFFVRKELPIGKYIKTALIFVPIGALTYGTTWLVRLWLGSGIVSLILQIVFGAIVYLALSLVYFLVTKNEIVMSYINRGKKILHIGDTPTTPEEEIAEEQLEIVNEEIMEHE